MIGCMGRLPYKGIAFLLRFFHAGRSSPIPFSAEMSGICLLHCTFVLVRNPTLGVRAFGDGLVWHFVKGLRPLALWPPAKRSFVDEASGRTQEILPTRHNSVVFLQRSIIDF
jgi:hypothetical protein